MDTIFLALRVLVSLGAVLLLVWLLHKRLSRGQRAKRATGRMSLVARQPLGRRASAVLVEADGQTLLLGVTDTSVTVLHEGPPTAAATHSAAPVSGDEADSDTAEGDDVGSEASTTPTLEPVESYADVAARVESDPKAFLGGSILSPTTWRQAVSAFRQAR